jgi:FtsP/CotA-like multicopper oxidase with cupredoxin domain
MCFAELLCVKVGLSPRLLSPRWIVKNTAPRKLACKEPVPLILPYARSSHKARALRQSYRALSAIEIRELAMLNGKMQSLPGAFKLAVGTKSGAISRCRSPPRGHRLRCQQPGPLAFHCHLLYYFHAGMFVTFRYT